MITAPRGTREPFHATPLHTSHLRIPRGSSASSLHGGDALSRSVTPLPPTHAHTHPPTRRCKLQEDEAGASPQNSCGGSRAVVVRNRRACRNCLLVRVRAADRLPAHVHVWERLPLLARRRESVVRIWLLVWWGRDGAQRRKAQCKIEGGGTWCVLEPAEWGMASPTSSIVKVPSMSQSYSLFPCHEQTVAHQQLGRLRCASSCYTAPGVHSASRGW